MARLVYLAVLLLTIVFSALPVKGLICYSCTQLIGEPYGNCQYDPGFVNTTSLECSKKYCVTKFVEYADINDGQIFISRSCEDNPPVLDGSVAGDGMTTYYQACTTDLCNVGNGKQSVSEIPDVENQCIDQPCVSNDGRRGMCMSSYACYVDHGTNMGPCSTGRGTCCMHQYACGQTTTKTGAYFVNPDLYIPDCRLTVKITDPTITQLRLEFNKFTLAQPNGGTPMNEQAFSCDQDRFSVVSSSSGPINLGFQYLCGENTGQHIYVPVNANMGYATVELIVQTNRNVNPRWEIGVLQIDCNSPSTANLCAPQGCLQYFPNSMGVFESFNYPGGSYLGNLHYDICFKRSLSSCGMRYTAQSFQMATDDMVAPHGDQGCSQDPGSGTPSFDYVQIMYGKTDNGITDSKFCGDSLSQTSVTTSAPGTPFVEVVTDQYRDNVMNGEEKGFRFNYQEVAFGCLMEDV